MTKTWKTHISAIGMGILVLVGLYIVAKNKNWR